jgi:cytochrome c
VTKQICALAVLPAMALSLIHPFGPVKQQHSQALLTGVQWDDPRVLQLFERACQNCHSQRTQWPFYSHLPVVSWALEKDVAEARRHMDLSLWDRYSPDQKRDLLASIAAEVRGRQMPLPRYVLLHSEARLSDAEIQLIYDWTKSERRALKKSGE